MAVTSNKDKVRLAVGDTDETAPLLYDDEVDACLSANTILITGGSAVNVTAAAADAAGAIAARFAREFNFATDGQRFDRAQKVGHYQALERQLRNRSGGYSQPLTLAGTATT